MTLPLRLLRVEGASRGRTSAQAMVEAALILPFLILLLVGVVDFGRVFYHQIVLANAAREGARIGTSPIATDAQIIAATTAAAASISGSSLFICCTITPASRAGQSGQPITVTVRYSMPIITPGMSQLLQPLLDGNGRLVVGQTVRMVIV